MAAIPLTSNVCARLRDSNDYTVLVSRPIVKIVRTEELVQRQFGGFIARYRVTLLDADANEVLVVFPEGAEIPGEDNVVTDETVIKIERMVRIPNGRNESIIVVYTAEVVTEDFELQLTDKDQENRRLERRLQLETEGREAVERRLRATLPPNLGDLAPEALINLVLDVLVQISELGTQAVTA